MTTCPATGSLQGLQAAIDKLAADGGGRLDLEPKRYRCGTLQLHSGVTLHLPEGCVLEAGTNREDFPILGSTYNETGEIRALIHAEDAERIAITGRGCIRGSGDQPLKASESEGLGFRPETVFFRNCRNVLIEDVTIRDSSFWTIHLLRCEEVDLRGLTIRNRLDRINTDGIDPDGCRRVRIRDCHIETGDDCIVLKSTEGDKVEDITVSGCRLRTPCAAIKIGTETIGDIGRVHITDCRIEESEIGLGVFLKDGGTVHDIVAEDLRIDSPGEFPLFIDHTPRFSANPKEGALRSITLRGLRVSSPGRLFVQGGYASFLESLRLESIEWIIPHPMALARMGKPNGSLRGSQPERAHRPEREAFQICLANIRDLSVHDFRIHGVDERLPEGRGLLYAEAVSGTVAHFSFPEPHPSCLSPVKCLEDTRLSGL